METGEKDCPSQRMRWVLTKMVWTPKVTAATQSHLLKLDVSCISKLSLNSVDLQSPASASHCWAGRLPRLFKELPPDVALLQHQTSLVPTEGIATSCGKRAARPPVQVAAPDHPPQVGITTLWQKLGRPSCQGGAGEAVLGCMLGGT